MEMHGSIPKPTPRITPKELREQREKREAVKQQAREDAAKRQEQEQAALKDVIEKLATSQALPLIIETTASAEDVNGGV